MFLAVVMKRFPVYLLIAVALAPAGSYAYDSYTETYQIMGCRSYLEGKSQHRGWLMGYLTTYEMQRGSNALQGRPTAQIFSRFDSYCRANPRRNMDEAADYVIRSFRRR